MPPADADVADVRRPSRVRQLASVLLLAIATALAAVGIALAAWGPPTLQLMFSFLVGPLVLASYALLIIAIALYLTIPVVARPAASFGRVRRSARIGAIGTVAILLITVAAAHGVYARERVVVVADGARLVGTIYAPRGNGPRTAVVLLPGAGSVPRRFLHLYADKLARRGYVVANFDKRGVGDSGGDWRDIDDGQPLEMLDSIVLRRARDVGPVIDSLKARHDVHPARIVLLGISQGGWVAPVVAAGRNDVAGTIILSGPTVSGGEERTFSDLTGEDQDHFGFNPPPIPFDSIYRIVDSTRSRGFDPMPHLRRAVTPGLWLFGEWDNSQPVRISAARLDSLRAAGHPYRYVVFPEANHALMVARGPNRRQPVDFAPGVWDTTFAWLAGISRR